jgi:transposase
MIPAQVRIFVCTEPVDMRHGFDRLAQRIRAEVREDPEGGSLFVFSNRGATRLKVLWFESNGFCMLYKRLHRAVFEIPAPKNGAVVHIDAVGLAKLLRGAARHTNSRRGKHENLDSRSANLHSSSA